MRQKTKIIFLTVSLLLITSLGCQIPGFGQTSSAEQTPAETADLEATAVAATVSNYMTQAASLTAETGVGGLSSTETPAVIYQTATPGNTATPSLVPPTQTPFPSFTPKPPTATATATALPCNWVKFVSDVTIPDGTDFTGNESFTKTWRLKNIGSCTWTSDYSLVFQSGAAMGGPAAKNLNTTVAPGQTVDVSVDLVAPNEKGTYQGFWRLRSNGGIVFGVGESASTSFWVTIDVVELMAPPDPNEPLDFAASYCSASWSSSTRTSLPCPASAIDFSNGSVTRTDSPRIESDYQDDEITLITVPSDGSGGVISGRYPAINVQAGDHFSALVGCMSGSNNCDVMFQLNYRANGGSIQNLGSWTETFDGNRTHINVDLSGLAGDSVEFILVVQNNGDSDDDRAFWMVPRIVR